jgi:N-acetylmuramoyl-L-alanine amidase
MKIAIDRAHGVGQDRGAVGIIAEESAVDIILNGAIPELVKLGHVIREVRPPSATSVGNSLAQRCTTANDWGADLYVSQHANAGGGDGAEVYTYQGEQLPEAQRYLEYLQKYGVKSRGIKDGSDLAVINGTKMRAILLEPFFVDYQPNVDFFNTHKWVFVNALVYAITGVDIYKPNVPTNTNDLYRVQFGAFKDKNNAEKLVEDLKKQGINAIVK